MEKRCYALLGLRPGASRGEIRSAFHRLARRCHPDTAPPGGADAARFQELLRAYRLLCALPPAKGRTAWHLAFGERLRRWVRCWWGDAQRWLGDRFRLGGAGGAGPPPVDPRPMPAGQAKETGRCAPWPSFAQVLSARQRVPTSRYMLCEDGIIRQRKATGSTAEDKGLRGASGLSGTLHIWWGALLMFAVSGWELFRR